MKLLNSIFEYFEQLSADKQLRCNERLIHAAMTADKKSLLKTFEHLILNNSDVNYKDEHGDTALMHLANRFIYKDNQEIFDILISNGARYDLTNNENKTFIQINSELYKRIYPYS